MNPEPNFMPLINAHPDIWRDFKPNPDLETGRRVVRILREAGVDASEDPKFDWMIDTEISIIGLFGCKTPPVTIISQDSHWDPFYHIRIGAALRPLRKEGYLLIGSGGATHNLYNTDWKYMLNYKDVLAMEHPPNITSIEFRQSFQDVIMKNGGGPGLRRGLARLMKHPYFRDAHGTDEHYISACFVAGAAGDPEDKGTKVEFGAETWELVRNATILPIWIILTSHNRLHSAIPNIP